METIVPDTTNDPLLTERFEEAFALACRLHRLHLRKSSSVPYLSHLMSVAALVLEDGGDEDEAIAALLHDALEDAADQITGEELERQFGPQVRAIVEACTDTPPEYAGGEKPDWKSRKTRYIQQVKTARVAHRVSLADKVHNARSIIRDRTVVGEAVWDRFRADREETLWYYRELAKAFRAAGATGFLMEELEGAVRRLESRAE
jgi:(p)ppGpp synthase/HD superfamily hydrolase